MENYNTLYRWCLLNNIRPLNIIDEDEYMLEEIPLSIFKEFYENKDGYKVNSMPRKPEKFLELRMYGFVPYNISPIQQGIQFNHANDKYVDDSDRYKWFKEEWMTNIILNGGTSNEGHTIRQGFKDVVYTGTMQQHLDDLVSNEINVGTFYEPDLNSMLTAIVFLVDERVFNKELYPDFKASPMDSEGDEPTIEEITKWNVNYSKQYASWVEKIGGAQNEFLRAFLADKRLA